MRTFTILWRNGRSRKLGQSTVKARSLVKAWAEAKRTHASYFKIYGVVEIL